MKGHFVYNRNGGTVNGAAAGLGAKSAKPKKAKRQPVAPEVCEQVAAAVRANEFDYRIRERFKISRVGLEYVKGEMYLGRYGGWGTP